MIMFYFNFVFFYVERVYIWVWRFGGIHHTLAAHVYMYVFSANTPTISHQRLQPSLRNQRRITAKYRSPNA
jgi:hypothetical protein